MLEWIFGVQFPVPNQCDVFLCNSVCVVSSASRMGPGRALCGLLLLSLVGGSSQASETKQQPAPTAKKQPHILFVIADDFGYNDIG